MPESLPQKPPKSPFLSIGRSFDRLVDKVGHQAKIDERAYCQSLTLASSAARGQRLRLKAPAERKRRQAKRSPSRRESRLGRRPLTVKSTIWSLLFSAIIPSFAQYLPKSKETKSLNMVGPSMRTGETLRYPPRQNRTVAGLLDRRQLESASFTPCEEACRIPGFPPSRREAWRAKHGTGPSSGACQPSSMRCRRGRCRPPRSCRRG